MYNLPCIQEIKEQRHNPFIKEFSDSQETHSHKTNRNAPKEWEQWLRARKYHGDRKGEPEGGVIPGNYTEGTLEDI